MTNGITITINAETAEAAKKVQEFFGGITEKLNELSGAGEFLQELGGKLLAAFTLGAIVEEFNDVIEQVENFRRALEKTGLSIQALNGLKTLATESRIPFENLTLYLTQFNDRIFSAIRMGGDQAKVFRDLKVSITDSSGALLSNEAVLRQVMDRFREMPAGIEKTAAAQELFGRGSRELIPLLNEGAEGLDRMKAAGGGINAEDIAEVKEYSKAMVELKEQLEAIARKLLLSVVPALKEFIEYLKDGVLAIELGHFAEFFELSMKSAIQEISNFFSQEIGKWTTKVDALMNKASEPGNWSKAGNAIAGVGTGLLAEWNLFGAKLGVPGAQEMADKRVEQTNEFFRKAGIADGILNRAADAFVAGTQGLPNEYKEALEKFRTRVKDEVAHGALSRTGEKPGNLPTTFEAASAATGGSFFANPKGGTPSIISEEAKKLIEQVDKEYRDATQSKLSLLDLERDLLIKKLELEVNDQARLEQEKIKVLETYAAKRKEILSKQAAEQAQIQLAVIEGRVKSLQKDPDINDADKRTRLIPMLQAENVLVQQNLELQRQRITDPALNEETKISAQRELVKLTEQQVNLQRQLKDMQTHGFSGTMSKGLTGLQNEWGASFQDLEHNVAGGALDGIRKGVNGVGDAIMGALTHTRTWGQVFAQVGTGIVASLINIVVQWIASMTLIAALKSIFKIKDTTDAAESAVAWAPAAIAASIASYGAAAAVGTAAYLSALFSGTAITAGVSSVSGFEAGGFPAGTNAMIRVNENGQEAVLNNRAVRTVGKNFIDNLNAGIFSAYHLSQAIPGILTQPITSDASAFQQLAAEGAAARGMAAGSAGPVTVQGHKMTIIQPRTKQEVLDAMASAEGQAITVRHVRNRRLDIGLGT